MDVESCNSWACTMRCGHLNMFFREYFYISHMYTLRIDLVWILYRCWTKSITQPCVPVISRSDDTLQWGEYCLFSCWAAVTETRVRCLHETCWRHHFLSHYLNTNTTFVSSDSQTAVLWWFDCFKCTSQLCWKDAVALRRMRIDFIGSDLFML